MEDSTVPTKAKSASHLKTTDICDESKRMLPREVHRTGLWVEGVVESRDRSIHLFDS